MADQIDFLNIYHDDNAKININDFLGGPGDPPATSENYIAATATVAAHELGHLAGLRHGDSFGPIGSGIHNPPGPNGYFPQYPGPTGADETTGHLMASPGSVGSTLFDLVGDPFFSERSAVKLAFNENGTVEDEQLGTHDSISTAQPLTLNPLSVPNTLVTGDNVGKTFNVEAIHVFASIEEELENDFYSFTGNKGDIFNLEVMSNALGYAFPIDSVVEIFDSTGGSVDYYGTSAFNDDEFETYDSIIIDLQLPANDTYFVNVSSFFGDEIGDYELFMYTFSVPEPDTIVMLAVGVIGLLTYRTSRRRLRRSK